MFLTTGNEGSSAQFTLIVNCSIDWRRKETAGGPADVFWRPLSTSRFLKASSTCSTSRASSSSTIWTQRFRTKLMDTSTSTRFWRRALWTSFAVGDHFITDFESCYWSFNFTQTLRWGDKFANGRKLAITCAASTGDFFFFFSILALSKRYLFLLWLLSGCCRGNWIGWRFRITQIVMERAVRPWLHLDCLFNLSSLGKENQRCTQILHDFTNQVGSIVLYFSLCVDELSMNWPRSGHPRPEISAGRHRDCAWPADRFSGSRSAEEYELTWTSLFR